MIIKRWWDMQSSIFGNVVHLKGIIFHKLNVGINWGVSCKLKKYAKIYFITRTTFFFTHRHIQMMWVFEYQTKLFPPLKSESKQLPNTTVSMESQVKRFYFFRFILYKYIIVFIFYFTRHCVFIIICSVWCIDEIVGDT